MPSTLESRVLHTTPGANQPWVESLLLLSIVDISTFELFFNETI
jgi:hypothetical protein